MSENKKIKCVVWDLDNTLWDGILVENQQVSLSEDIVNIIKEFDKRGILNSISSKNNYDDAMKKLEFFNMNKYFLYPEINWNNKSESISRIQKNLNIGMESIAFIDDQQFELDEVNYVHPEVLCIKNDCFNLLERQEFIPRFITDESSNRRELYQSEANRKKIEESYEGPQINFLRSLQMVMTIKEADFSDLQRVEELTIRTHQLNTTGYTYTYDELKNFVTLGNYKLYVAGLDDKYGSYGKIGIILLECDNEKWVIKLLLMSCRVMSRGVGNVFMNFIIERARNENKELYAEFKHTDRNRMMFITYKLGGFQETSDNNQNLLKYDFTKITTNPDYVLVKLL